MKLLAKKAGIESLLESSRIIHVTGTNGKGSCCAYAEMLLLASGASTICNTSPHFLSVRERIRVNGAPVDKATFAELLNESRPYLEEIRGTYHHPDPTTVILFLTLLLHHKMGSDVYGVYEVGAGGKTDASNVFANAVVGLTEVGEDHVKQFGGTLESVLLEKLALCRAGNRLIHLRQRATLDILLRDYCRQFGIVAHEMSAHQIAATGTGWAQILLQGEWQAENATLGRHLVGEFLPGLREDAAYAPYSELSPPLHRGRLETRFVGDHEFLIDGAHNPPALVKLLSHLKKQMGNSTCPAIIGFSQSDHWQQMVNMIVECGQFDVIVACTSTRRRSIEPEDIGTYLGRCGHAPFAVTHSLRSGLARMLQLPADRPIAIFGSLRLIADFDRSLHALGLARYAASLEQIDPEQSWMSALT